MSVQAAVVAALTGGIRGRKFRGPCVRSPFAECSGYALLAPHLDGGTENGNGLPAPADG